MPKTDPTTRRYYDRFDLLFYVSIATLGLLLLVDLDQETGIAEFLSIVVTMLTGTMLLLAVSAAGIGRKGHLFALIAVASTVLGSIALAFSPEEVSAQGGLLWLLLVVAAPVVALKRLMHHETVTVNTILGAVSVYLLMAIAGTYLFLYIDTLSLAAGPFFGEPQPTTVFAYFSIVTITTLGYGDFSPAEQVGRSAAAWIAVIGQIYLVVVVAYIVSVYTSSRPRTGSLSPSDDD